jgi:hypothetical protein
MSDYFALLGEARRPWIDPEKLKEKYFALARERPADAELNEAYRVLSDPKLRLRHLLTLNGVDLRERREIPVGLAELFWNTGNLLREAERWLLKNSGATSAVARALLSGERARLLHRLEEHDANLDAAHDAALNRLRAWNHSPNESAELIELYDSIAYLRRLREQVKEKRLRLESELPG